MKHRALFLAALLFADTLFGGGSGRYYGTPISATTIDLYSDFQCPGCKQLYEQTIRPLIQNYASKGRVYLVEHYYPLPGHQYAVPAACYACAADRIGKYDQVCEVLFKKQDEWARTGNVDEAACSVLTPAEAKQVRALVKDPSVLTEVQNDAATGRTRNVSGTPTMFVTHNGNSQTIGLVSYPILSRYLDSLR
jgi:protein-disulfide isomerase